MRVLFPTPFSGTGLPLPTRTQRDFPAQKNISDVFPNKAFHLLGFYPDVFENGDVGQKDHEASSTRPCCVFFLGFFLIPFRSAGLLAIGAHAASRPWDFSIQPQSRTPHARKKAIAPSDTPRRGFITPAAAFYARTDPR